MFCGNIFTSTDLQNHKKNHMKKSQKRFHRVNRALFLSLSNAFEEQKSIPKISPKFFWSAPFFPKIVCGGQCEFDSECDSYKSVEFYNGIPLQIIMGHSLYKFASLLPCIPRRRRAFHISWAPPSLQGRVLHVGDWGSDRDTGEVWPGISDTVVQQ